MSGLPTAVPGLADRLRALYDTRYDIFHKLFTLGLPVAVDELARVDGLAGVAGVAGVADTLLAANMVEPDDAVLVCPFRIARLANDFLVTDRPEYPGVDRVLYLSDNESLLRARTLPRCDGLRVLDLGSGSGVQAVAAYRRGAAAVTSIDLNPRAIALTRFNLAVNGLPTDDVRLVPLAEFQPEQRYDVLVNNPPFVPVPPGTRFMTSGAGGIDGLDFVRALIARLPELVHDRTAICLVSLSPGTRQLSELEALLLDHLGDRPMALHVARIFPRPSPIADSLAPFAGQHDVAGWAAKLAARGYTHLHNMLLTALPAAVPEFHRTVLHPAVQEHPGNTGSVDWAGLYAEIRLALEMAHKVMANSAAR